MTIEASLAALHTTAPRSVHAGVMVETGLWDRYTVVDGPIEPVYVAWNPRGITACVPASAVGDDEAFEQRHPRSAVRADSLPPRLASRVGRALETGRLGSVPVDLSALGDFQRAVLTKCAEIPPGQIRPYGWIAAEIGNPAAVRAVGTALARNPVPILVPCHRVVRTDGRIGNYAYGSEMKRALLEAEGVDTDVVEETAQRGIRFIGSDTTGIFCYPTCHHAGRIADEHVVEFRSATEAEDRGYRACKVCRPAA